MLNFSSLWRRFPSNYYKQLTLGALLCAFQAGCSTAELGECDELAARQLVFDQNGTPAYAGQAQLMVSCGNGGFCHSAEASGPLGRFGAPGHLNFDMNVAATGADPAEAATDRLRRGVSRVREYAESIFTEVDAQRMPPFGEATITAHAGVPRFAFEDGSRLKLVDTFEGLEVLQNWLACGAPVVERTTPRGAGVEPVGDIVPAQGSAIQPTFSSIYNNYISPTCGQACHGPNIPTELARSNLNMSTQGLAYTALVNQAAAGEACGSTTATRVIPGDAAGALITQKLSGSPPCGESMPIGGTVPAGVLTALQQWINDGALDN